MTYQYIPEHLKKAHGRPRKYEFTERPKPKYIPRERNRQQAAEMLRGIPVVQLDYYTGEYVGEYPSITSAENDMDLKPTSLVSAFRSKKSCFAMIHVSKVLFMKKSDYDRMKASFI